MEDELYYCKTNHSTSYYCCHCCIYQLNIFYLFINAEYPQNDMQSPYSILDDILLTEWNVEYNQMLANVIVFKFINPSLISLIKDFFIE